MFSSFQYFKNIFTETNKGLKWHFVIIFKYLLKLCLYLSQTSYT